MAVTRPGASPPESGDRSRPWWQWLLLMPVLIVGFAIAGDAGDFEPRSIARAPLAVRLMFRFAAALLLAGLILAGIFVYLAATT